MPPTGLLAAEQAADDRLRAALQFRDAIDKAATVYQLKRAFHYGVACDQREAALAASAEEYDKAVRELTAAHLSELAAFSAQ